MKKTYKINVDKEYIDQGTPQDSSCCAIALATRDLMIDREGFEPDKFDVDVSGEGRVRIFNLLPGDASECYYERDYIFTLEPIDADTAVSMGTFIDAFDQDVPLDAEDFTVEKIVEENYAVWRYGSNDRVWWRIARLLSGRIW